MRPASRVLIYRKDLLPPSETFIREQALALRRWRAELVGDRIVDGGLDIGGLAVTTLPAPRGRVARWVRRVCSRVAWPYPPHVTTLRRLDGKLLHAHFGSDAVEIAPVVTALGLPLLVTLHGYDINIRREVWESGGRGAARRSYPRRLLALARAPHTHFIAVSEAIKRRAVAWGIPAERISVNFIGVDCRRFSPGPVPLTAREPLVLYVGRLVEKKAPLVLLRAFAHVARVVPGARLVMIGDGPLRTAAEQLARDAALPVTFTGTLDPAQVSSYLAQARVFCLPSTTAANGDAEGLPISLLEAQASGVPVVTTAHSGNPEAVDAGRSGFIVPEGDSEALAERLICALTDGDFLATASGHAVAQVRARFDLTVCTERLEHVYDQVLDR
jgi:glycosyltransferase involved in cell wall biosynthesis